MDDNDDERPRLVQRGGLWCDEGSWMSYPFGKLTVFRQHFEVNGARFTAQNVVVLKRIRGLFASGLRIDHSNPNTGKKPVFWSFDFPSLRAALERIGFRIEEPSNHWRDNPGPLLMFAWIVMLAIGGWLAVWFG